MGSIEVRADPIVSATPVGDGEAGTAPATEPTEPGGARERPASAAGVLELAALTAERLVDEAKAEADALVSAARAEAERVREATRRESAHVAEQLARTRDEQVADLDRERAMALAGLAEEKGALEGRIATLRQLQSDHRAELREHLAQQLALLDAAVPQPPHHPQDG